MTSVSTDRRFGVNSSAAVKVPCRVATMANITLSGHQTIDGVLLVDDDRVLVKNQTDQKQNGIYDVDSGTWARAPDWDGSYDAKAGSLVYITSGTTNGGALYVCTTSDPITIGTTNVAFAVVALSSLITLPLPLAQGGTGGTSDISSLANLGVIQITAEGGTANAQTGTVDALVTGLRPDQLFIFAPNVTNTGATTLAINSLIAKAVRANGVALVGGELVAGVPVLLHYDGFFSILGALTKTGDIDLSTGNLRGIKFDATQNASSDANTLDDYAEGTWTPTLKLGGGTTGITYGTQAGRYTKIGRVVIVDFVITLTSKGSSTGVVSISGLPFAATAAGGSNAGFTNSLFYAILNTNWVGVIGQITPSATPVISVLGNTAAAVTNATNLQDTDLTNTTTFRGTITYVS